MEHILEGAVGACLLILYMLFVWIISAPTRIQPYTLEKFADDLVEFEIVTKDKIRGCSDIEISEIMKSQNVDHLPEGYVTFLKMVGKTEINLPNLLSLFYPDILQNKEFTFHNHIWEIPENSFIVSTRRVDSDSIMIYFMKINNDIPKNPITHTIEFYQNDPILINFYFTRHLELWMQDARQSKSEQQAKDNLAE